MKTTTENLEEKMGDLDELIAKARGILEALECAACVETPADFDANLDEAHMAAKGLAAECAELLK